MSSHIYADFFLSPAFIVGIGIISVNIIVLFLSLKKNRTTTILDTFGKITESVDREDLLFMRRKIYDDSSEIPYIFNNYWDAQKMPLFLIHEGLRTDSNAALSVRYDRKRYSVPESEYGNPSGHKSLELFVFVRHRLDQAYGEAQFPPSNTLLVR